MGSGTFCARRLSCADFSNVARLWRGVKQLEDETKVISFLNELKMLGMIFNGYTQTNAFFTFADGFLLEGHQQQNDNSHNIQYHLMNLG